MEIISETSRLTHTSTNTISFIIVCIGYFLIIRSITHLILDNDKNPIDYIVIASVIVALVSLYLFQHYVAERTPQVEALVQDVNTPAKEGYDIIKHLDGKYYLLEKHETVNQNET